MEMWDIYDKDKKLTGRQMERNNWTLKDDEYHLTVLGVIERRDGKYLITQRAADKAWAAGWWEVSGGGVMAGETSEQAVMREVLEETGLDVSKAEGGYAFTYHRENPGRAITTLLMSISSFLISMRRMLFCRPERLLLLR